MTISVISFSFAWRFPVASDQAYSNPHFQKSRSAPKNHLWDACEAQGAMVMIMMIDSHAEIP